MPAGGLLLLVTLACCDGCPGTGKGYWSWAAASAEMMVVQGAQCSQT